MEAAIQGLRDLNADIIINITAPSKYYRDTYWAAKRAGIPIRIGNLRKFQGFLTCNRLVNVARSKSNLHETQLDMKFLKALGLKYNYSLKEITELRRYKPIPQTADCLKLLDKNKFNLILHPKTRGQYIEWPITQFAELINLLPTEKFNVFVTGSEKEGEQVRDIMITPFPQVIDLCGKISLNDLMQLIAHADGLIAASTGPVHLAANFGIYTLGLYSPRKPFDAVRWGPVGKKAETLSPSKMCASCQRGDYSSCQCLESITTQEVFSVLNRWVEAKHNATNTL